MYNPYNELSIYMNPFALARKVASYEDTGLTGKQLKAWHLHRFPSWPLRAAQQKGVIDLTLRQADLGQRWYTTGAWTVQQMPGASGMKEAIGTPFAGHCVLHLDWTASHWQFLAHASGDANLRADLLSGNFYETVVPGVERKVAKVALNGLLNGMGLDTLAEKLGDRDEALTCVNAYAARLQGRWAKTLGFLAECEDWAVKEGLVPRSKAYTGPSLYLQRIEAEALRGVCSDEVCRNLGMKVLMPDHDAVYLSVPEENAEQVRNRAVALMIDAVARGYDVPEAGLVVTSYISKAMAEDADAGTWEDAEAEAYEVLQEDTAIGTPLALCAIIAPAAFHAKMQTHGRRTARRAAYTSALQLARSVDRRSLAERPLPQLAAEIQTEPLLVIREVLRRDHRFAHLTPSVNVREWKMALGDTPYSKSVARREVYPLLVEHYNASGMNRQDMYEALVDEAEENAVDPVMNYFDELEWDGVPRVVGWMEKVFPDMNLGPTVVPEDGSPGYPLTYAYGLRMLLSVVARTYKPGCQVHSMLLLYGGQKAGKSTSMRLLAPLGSHISEELKPSDKDKVVRVNGKAIVEWGEMAGAGGRELERLKEYITRSTDVERPPYGDSDRVMPRRGVFVATTNDKDVLTDHTGSRRFWPVDVGNKKKTRDDFKWLEENKDQLWAEAVYLFKKAEATAAGGESLLWLTPEEDKAREQESFDYQFEDPIEVDLLDYVKLYPGHLVTKDYLRWTELKTPHAKAVGKALRKLGFEQTKVTRSGRQIRAWKCPPELSLGGAGPTV